MSLLGRHSWFFVVMGLSAVTVWSLTSCGHQAAPNLGGTERGAREARLGSESVSAKSFSAARAASVQGSEETDPSRIQVFAKPMEPLTLQRGGSVRVSIPLADEISSSGMVRAVEVKLSAEGLTGNIVQGKTLSLSVGEEAIEGRYTGRLLVRLSNGREAVQSFSVSVIP